MAALPGWLYELLAEPARAPEHSVPCVGPNPGRVRRYGEAALEQATLTVATAPAGARNATLFREAVSLAELVGAEVLPEERVRRETHERGPKRRPSVFRDPRDPREQLPHQDELRPCRQGGQTKERGTGREQMARRRVMVGHFGPRFSREERLTAGTCAMFPRYTSADHWKKHCLHPLTPGRLVTSRPQSASQYVRGYVGRHWFSQRTYSSSRESGDRHARLGAVADEGLLGVGAAAMSWASVATSPTPQAMVTTDAAMKRNMVRGETFNRSMSASYRQPMAAHR